MRLPLFSSLLIAGVLSFSWTKLSSAAGSSSNDEIPLYKQANQPVDARVQDLLSRMTLQEKVNQLLNPVGTQDGPGHFAVNATYILNNYGSTGVGTLYTGISGCPGLNSWECQNFIQSSIINSSRLNIPISFIGETLTAGTAGGTIFPQPILQGSTFNLELISAIGTSIARQARLGGIDRGLSPVLQVDTDVRFGRFEEAYGEDPFLVSQMGVTVATALQGNTNGPNTYLDDDQHVSLEAKHALSYGFGGRDWYETDLSDRTLYDVYGKPWRAFIREAGGRGAMIAHPAVNGLPLHGSKLIMTDVLRNWYGYGANGTGAYLLLASDWGNVEFIPNMGVAQDQEHGAAMAVASGLDNEMSPPPLAMTNLVDAVNNNILNIAYVDRAAGNNLREKFATGLFDGAWYINVTAAQTQLDTPADRALAYRVASEGIVLLKNDKNVLPIQGVGQTIKTIALVGTVGACLPNEHYPCAAQQAMIGHYVQTGAAIVTLAEALGNTSGITFTYTPAASIESYNLSGISDAVTAAQNADFTIIAVGDSTTIGTGTCSEMHDADVVDLPGSQLNLISAIANGVTKPFVTVLFTCRPVTFGAGPFSEFGPNNALLNQLSAVIEAWRPGEEAGNAVWDIIRGRTNPSGRLTQNWVRGAGAVKSPASPYLQYRGNPTDDYVTEPATSLFPFGYGLTYSTTTYSNVAISPNPSTTIFTYNDTFTVSGSITTTTGPAGRLSLLLFFSQNAPTKWVRYEQQLVGFGKFDIPAANNGTSNFAITARIKDMDAYEPDTEDYELQTGNYTVTLRETSVSTPIATWTLAVNGTYTWVWDFMTFP